MPPKTFERPKIFVPLALIVTLGLIAMSIFPTLTRTSGSKRAESNKPASEVASEDSRALCQTRLKQVALVLMMYSQDSDEKLPPAKNSADGLENSNNWVGALRPYIETTEIFQCPLDQTGDTPQRSSFGYNKRLSEFPSGNLRHPSATIAYFEVDSTRTASTQTGSEAKDITAATRHDEGANYAMTDGSVRWLRPKSITPSHKYSDEFTFAVK